MYPCADHLLTNKTKVGMSHSSVVGKALRAVGLAAILALAGCGGGGAGDPAAPTGAVVAIAPSLLSIELPVGATGPLNATATLDDGTTVDITSKAEWRVSDSNLVVISDADVVKSLKGNAQGNVTLTIVYQGKEIVVPVKIGPHQFLGLVVSGGPASATLGSDPVQLKAVATYSDGPVDVTTQAVWSSSDSAVASVSASGPGAGLLDAKKIGKTKISAKLDDNAVEASFDFEVVTSLLKSLTIVGAVTPVVAGDTAKWTAVAHYEDGSEKPVTAEESWSSSDPAVATVKDGFVTAIKVGSTVIKVSLGGKETSQSLMIVPPVLTRLTIDVTTQTYMGVDYSVVIPKGLSTTVFASGVMSVGPYESPIAGVTWEAMPNNVIEVRSLAAHAESQEIIAKGPVGSEAILTASHEGVPSVTVKITVGPPILTGIAAQLSPAVVSLILPGPGFQLSAMGTFTDNTTADVTNLVNCLASSGIITVDDKCVVTANAVGVATVEATLKNTKGTATVKVSAVNTQSVNVGTVSAAGAVAKVPVDGAAAPFDLGGATPFAVSGVTPGTVYTLRVQGGSRLRVAADQAMNSRWCEDDVATGGSLACVIQPTSGQVFFTVQGLGAGIEAPVYIGQGAAVDSGPFVVESIKLGPGEKADPRQYVLLGAENAAYTVSMVNENAVLPTWVAAVGVLRADGNVCSNEAPEGSKRVACGLAPAGTAASFGVASVYYIQTSVDKAEDVRVTVSPGAFATEGTSAAPIPMVLDRELSGQIAANGSDPSRPSVYGVAMVPANKTVDFVLYGASSQLRMEVSRPNSDSVAGGGSTNRGGFNSTTGRLETRVTINSLTGSSSAPGFKIKVYAELTGSPSAVMPSAESGGTPFKLIVIAR